MGGTEKDSKVAGRGGIFCGIMLGLLIILINVAMFVKIDVVAGVDMPTLELANQIHLAVGVLMSIALLGMMYNTAVGMFYAYTVRFFAPHKFSRESLLNDGLFRVCFNSYRDCCMDSTKKVETNGNYTSF